MVSYSYVGKVANPKTRVFGSPFNDITDFLYWEIFLVILYGSSTCAQMGSGRVYRVSFLPHFRGVSGNSRIGKPPISVHPKNFMMVLFCAILLISHL